MQKSKSAIQIKERRRDIQRNDIQHNDMYQSTEMKPNNKVTIGQNFWELCLSVK
jgi:hypothetical protein